MRRPNPLALWCCVAALALAGCVRGLGPQATPQQRAQISFSNNIRLAYLAQASMARNITLRLEQDCPTGLQDDSPLCMRTRSQLEPFARQVVRAKGLLDEARKAYDEAGEEGPPSTMLAAAVQAVLDLSKTATALRLAEEAEQ